MSGMSWGDTRLVRRLPRLIVVLLTVSIGTLAGCTGGTDAVDQTAGGEYRFVQGTGTGQAIPASDRMAAPSVGGTRLDGTDWQLGAQRGKVVVMNFWAPWCDPCRTETPELDGVAKTTKSLGVEFMGVAVKSVKSDAERFVADEKVSYPSLFDAPGKTVLRFRDLRTNGLPFTVVIDRQGRVAAVYTTPLLAEDIQPVVTRLAAEG